jgi:hypothetical protein
MERRVQGWLLLFSMERVVRRGSPMESSLLSFSFVLPIVAYFSGTSSSCSVTSCWLLPLLA